jgi:multidrug resistance protein MdtO
MATLAQSVPESSPRSAWLWGFLKEELVPYPSRVSTVARMVIAATLVMIVCMTFRIPYGFQGAIFALFVSRESPRATLKSAGIMGLVTGIGVAYVLISARFVIDVPFLHFLWIAGSLFLTFYAISALPDYNTAVPFAILISAGLPFWDRHVSAETNVEDTLRLLLSSLIGVVLTAAVELAFSRRKPGDDIVIPLVARLTAVRSLLTAFAEGRPVDQATRKTVARLGVRGTSIYRRLLRRSGYSAHYRAQMSAVVDLVGRLVDVIAPLMELTFEPSDTDRKRLRSLSGIVASIGADLLNRRIPSAIHFAPDDERSGGVPFLQEMETIVSFIPQAFSGSRSIDEYLPSSDDVPRPKWFAPSGLFNPEYHKFALKGCLAATACYVIYNSVAWPGISTAVTTCLLTALSTIGASRQKQILRFAGAIVGGFVIGMGSQIFILPHLDSIGGFTVLFMVVTALASWVMTSSPRLSYFGVQVALAFYLINLQEFTIQTSLAVARDRVVGILLGLIMMWLVFDQLWSSPAGVEMKRRFVLTFRLLAQLAREPVSTDIQAMTKRIYALRESIDNEFNQVRALADGVLFEFGPSRQQDLAMRDHIRHWQPQLRTLFIMRIASLKYRLQVPGFELPEPIRLAQQAYDDRSAQMLDEMAGRIEGSVPQAGTASEDAFELLEKTVQAYYEESQQPPTAHVWSFTTLLRGIDNLTNSLAAEIAAEVDRAE